MSFTSRLAPWLKTSLVMAVTLLGASSCVTDPNDVNTVTEEAVCASGATVEGVDVSVYQGGSINWNSVHASGRQFAITRVNDGISSLDPTFRTNWAGIRAAGMVRGAYQFFRPNDNATTQANIVCSALGRLGAGDLPAMLDLEVSGGQSSSTIIAGITTWLHAVEACTGKRPMIYTAGWFWNPNVGSTAFGSYPLVVAAYGPTCPTLPTGWSTWKIFQYSDGTIPSGLGPVPGIGQSCDRDRFNGSLADLMNYAGAGAAWGGQFVAQSFPYAAVGTIQVHQGASVPVWITMRNIGTRSWTTETRLATTQPRDRTSRFAGTDWVAPDRPDAVTGTIAPGATYRFNFTINAPATLAPGRYTEYFGMVQESVAWFSDPGNAGPADNQLEAIVEVLTALPMDAGTPDASVRDASLTDAHVGDVVVSDAMHGDAAVANDGGVGDAAAHGDGASRDGANGDAGPDGGSMGHVMGGCGCRIDGATHPSQRNQGLALAAVAALAAVVRRRRRAA